MICYSDVVYPHKQKAALNPRTGAPLNAGTLSGGELGFARIAKVIVDNRQSLDWAAIDELYRLLKS
jgi:hypothetical protein